MTTELKITVEAVKRAAEKCGTAKEVLKELFPEVFGERWVAFTPNFQCTPYNTGKDRGLFVALRDGDEQFGRIQEGKIKIDTRDDYRFRLGDWDDETFFEKRVT